MQGSNDLAIQILSTILNDRVRATTSFGYHGNHLFVTAWAKSEGENSNWVTMNISLDLHGRSISNTAISQAKYSLFLPRIVQKILLGSSERAQNICATEVITESMDCCDRGVFCLIVVDLVSAWNEWAERGSEADDAEGAAFGETSHK